MSTMKRLMNLKKYLSNRDLNLLDNRIYKQLAGKIQQAKGLIHFRPFLV
jgi:hypothetical protein